MGWLACGEISNISAFQDSEFDGGVEDFSTWEGFCF